MLFGDQIKEETATTGTGTVTLTEVTGFTRFSERFSVNDVVGYAISDGNNWETGIGTVGASNTLARTTILSTLVSGTYDDTSPTAITLSGGATVFCALPAAAIIDRTASVFDSYLIRDGASILGTSTDTHINLGSNSVTGTAALSRPYATVLGGDQCEATASYSTAVAGLNNTATGIGAAVVGGSGGDATGNYSFVGGGSNGNAGGTNSFVGGGDACQANNTFNGTVCGESNTCNVGSRNIVGGGSGCTVTGTATYAGVFSGRANDVDGNYSGILQGRGNHATHTHSQAGGGGSETRANFDFVWGATDTATPSTANNTIRLQGTGGNVLIDGSVSSPEADYAEMFEWYDQNPGDQDRAGRFVSLYKGFIVQGAGRSDKTGIANYLASLFTNPSSATGVEMIGVVSGNPAVVGDAAPNHWGGRTLRDKYKRPLFDTYTKYYWEEDDVLKTPKTVYVRDSDSAQFSEHPQYTHDGIPSAEVIPGRASSETITIPQLNPAYNPQLPYIPRSERPEWDAIGLIGKLIVETAEPITADYVDPTGDGRAVNGSKYPVLEVIDNQTVRILFK